VLTLAAFLTAAALASCSDDDDSQGEPVPPPQPRLADTVRLQHQYRQGGRVRRVDAWMAFDNVTDPHRSSVLVPPPGARLVGAQLRILNRGPDPFPIRWARFRGYDQRGRPLPAGTRSTPLRRSMPNRPVRGQVLTSISAFTVPRGRRLASIRMRSIVRVWQFSARWTLPR
jgi:hypothetical protein